MRPKQAYAGHMPENGVNRAQSWPHRHLWGIFGAFVCIFAYIRHMPRHFLPTFAILCSTLGHQAFFRHFFSTSVKPGIFQAYASRHTYSWELRHILGIFEDYSSRCQAYARHPTRGPRLRFRHMPGICLVSRHMPGTTARPPGGGFWA